ncbi:MAG: RnfABCDGE type electron transport complex subunit D [bacterium]
MPQELIVSSSPHIRVKESTHSVMRDVIIALLLPLGFSIYFFGWYTFLVCLVSVTVCVLTEFLFEKVIKKKSTVGDMSAVVTGLLFAFVIPPTIPLWLVVIGAMVSIILGKQIFGGLGHNPFNPALVGRAVLTASWPVYMTTWVRPFDAVTSASPLGIVKEGLDHTLPSYMDMFIGNRAGSLGETSVFALLIGALYLLYRKQISWHIPITYVSTVAIISVLFNKDPLFNILAGGLILGAFFMATDMVTTPITKKGQLVFGFGCGFFTAFIRFTGGFPEGVCYSILIMNMFTPLIDKYTQPRRFGLVK